MSNVGKNGSLQTGYNIEPDSRLQRKVKEGSVKMAYGQGMIWKEREEKTIHFPPIVLDPLLVERVRTD